MTLHDERNIAKQNQQIFFSNGRRTTLRDSATFVSSNAIDSQTLVIKFKDRRSRPFFAKKKKKNFPSFTRRYFIILVPFYASPLFLSRSWQSLFCHPSSRSFEPMNVRWNCLTIKHPLSFSAWPLFLSLAHWCRFDGIGQIMKRPVHATFTIAAKFHNLVIIEVIRRLGREAGGEAKEKKGLPALPIVIEPPISASRSNFLEAHAELVYNAFRENVDAVFSSNEKKKLALQKILHKWKVRSEILLLRVRSILSRISQRPVKWTGSKTWI